MASYSEWNEAIARFLIEGAPAGESIYLSLDEDALFEIAAEWQLSDPVMDFEAAVREECVSGGRVDLPKTEPISPEGPPRCLAFLGAMVLAAHRMAPEGGISDINYFTRLREILGLTEGTGRPPGMSPPAPEEPLWIALNQWVAGNDLRPSAERGPDGPTKFTNYPLSQSLLREGDKGKLEGEFKRFEGQLGRNPDRERVGGWFFNRANDFSTSHIRNLANEVSTDRYEALVDAVYGVYINVDWNADRERPEFDGTRRRRAQWLTAGLYREFDPLSGQIAYLLFPRHQARELHRNLAIVRDGSPEPLRSSRDGQFYPLWPVNPAGEQTYELTGDPWLTELRIPSRQFWVLTRDHLDDTSRNFASRGSPRLGETFLLLCRMELEEQILFLRDEGLLEWTEDPIPVPNHEGWFEYRECMVLSANWDGIIFQIPELFEELRPRGRASISLQGGLKTDRRDTWLEGYLPEVFVTSFDQTCRVRVTNVLHPEDDPVMDDTISSNSPVGLPCLETGNYAIEVHSGRGGTSDRRHLRVVSWDALLPRELSETYGTSISGYSLQGGLLTADDDGGP